MIYYPYLWIGFSAYPSDLTRSWIELSTHSLRIGEIKYSWGIGRWELYPWRQRYRYYRRSPGQMRPRAWVKAVVKWHLHQERFWKPCRFLMNKPGRLWPWMRGHFRTWPRQPNHPKEGLVEIDGQ